jgi:spore germination protein YaaH
MDFNIFIKNNKVRRGRADPEKAKALLNMSDRTRKTVDTIKINETSASIVLTVSYESLREILEAISLLEGFKVYSHEAYTAYLQKLGEEKIAIMFDRLRKLRNGVNYYGKTVSIEVAKEALKDCKELCAILKRRYVILNRNRNSEL